MAAKKKSTTKKPTAAEFVPATTSLPGFPGVSSRALAGLAAKVRKGKDNYKKQDAIEDLVDYAERGAFYWALLRESVVPLWEEPLLWDRLREVRGWTPADVALLLSKITTYSTGSKSYAISLCLPSWPVSLDALAMDAVVADPSAFSAWESWSPIVKKGFETVLVRTGKREKLGAQFAEDLAKLHLAHYGLWETQRVIEDGQVKELTLFTKQTPNESFTKFVEVLTSKKELDAALARLTSTEEFLENPSQNLLSTQVDVMRSARVANLGRLMGKISLGADTWQRMADVLAVRKDEPAQLFDVARTLGGHEYMQELAVVRGVLRLVERGEQIPEDVDGLFSCRGIRCPDSPLEPASCLDDLVRALKALGTDRVRGVLRRVVEGDHTLGHAFPVLHAFLEEEAIVESAFERLKTYGYGGTRDVTFALGVMGPGALPLLEKWHDALHANHPVRGEWVRKGIQVVLAREAKAGHPWDERWDRFLDVHGFEKELNGKDLFNVDYDYSASVAPVVRQAVSGLSKERREKWLAANLDFERPSFARVIPAMPRDDLALIEEALVAIAPHAERLRMYSDWIQQLGNEVQKALLPVVRKVLEAAPSPILRKSFDAALGKENVDKALEGSEAAAVKEETPLEQIMRLAKKVGGETTTITILSTREDAPTGISRVGGPGYALGDKQPKEMTHIFTLSAQDAPRVKVVFPDAVAVALYVQDPDNNEAYEAYNEQTEVVALSAEDIARGTAEGSSKDLEELSVVANTIEVAQSAFFGESVDEKELNRAIYGLAGRTGGEPIWLQDEEEGGAFIAQFDESFASMNLGDSGVMYVFDDTAYWQCH